MNTQWDTSTKRIIAIGLGLFLVYVLLLSKSILPFLIIAALIAFLLAPIVNFLRNNLYIPKPIAVIIAYLLLALFITLFPLILIPAVLNAFGDINVDWLAVVQQTLTWLRAVLESWRSISLLGISYDLSPSIDPALETLNNISPTQFIPSLDTIIASIPTTLQFTWGVASNVVGTIASSLLAFMLTFVFSVYLTVDGSRFVQAIIKAAPPVYQTEMRELHRRIKAIWSAYFRGQFILAVVIGIMTWVVGTIIGLPGAFALAVIAGAMEILPNIGPILAAIPALLVAMVQGSLVLQTSNFTFMLIVLAAYALIQQTENNLIVPKILGDAVELHPLFVMAGVVVGATVAGIVGALIAAPTIASTRVLIAYAYAKIIDEDPFPTPRTASTSTPSIKDVLFHLWTAGQSLWQQWFGKKL